MTYTLIGADGEPYESPAPGTLGGHRRTKVYGRLDCPAALRWIATRPLRHPPRLLRRRADRDRRRLPPVRPLHAGRVPGVEGSARPGQLLEREDEATRRRGRCPAGGRSRRCGSSTGGRRSCGRRARRPRRRSRPRQLRVQQAAVAGEAAAGGGDRDDDLVGELARRRARASASSSEVAARAGRVDGDRAELALELEPRQQPLARPGDRVEDLAARAWRSALTSLSSGTRLARRARACTSSRRRRPAARRRRSSARAPRPCGWPSAARPSRSPSRSTASRSSARRRRAGSRAAARRGRDRDQRLGQARAVAAAPLRARPKIRLTQAAGRRPRRRRARSPAARRAPAAACSAGHSGTSSSLTRPARGAAGAAQRRRARRRPRVAGREAARGRRARPTPSARRAAARPARPARSAARARSSLTSLPVSIPSGQASAQVPSAAQVSSASYSYSLAAAPRAPASPARWRAISRRRTIRWRGVVVRSRLGQTGSQNPHSTQVVDLLLDRRRRLQVAQVDAGVVVEHHARARARRRGRRAA